jgi:2,4-dienoyl-CoA reductase (NADPH2)
MKFPTLFKPGMIGSMEVRNRIIMAALGTGLADMDGYITQRMIDYYEARAKGGVGLIISQISSISSTYTPPLIPRLFDDKYIPGLRKLSQATHKHGAKMAIQLGFPGINLLHQWKEIGIEARMEVVGPSPVPCVTYGITPRALARGEIKEIVKDFGKAAKRVREAGYDAVEIRGSHGYFISAFLSPFKNRRKDEYGGSVENRARLACEIISSVRQGVGNDFPIIFRMNGSDFIPGGTTLEQAVRQAPLFVQAGANALHISASIPEAREWRDLTYYHPSGALVPLAQEIKNAVNVPVIAVGKIGDPVLAEEILSEGKADFVAMARALFADPQLPKKAREGRPEDITKCLYCNNCRLPPNSSEIMQSIGVIRTCTVNPAVLRERDFHLTRMKSPKKVIVIGGGLAGLEAAIVAAERGHRVYLFEKSDRLGGQWNIASSMEHKKHFEDFTRQLIDRCYRSGTKVTLNKEVTPQLVRVEKPGVVVVATGASPKSLDVPGCDKPHVVQAVDVIAGQVEVGQRVAVIGGRLVGMEIADMLARLGKRVMLATKNRLGENGRTLERNVLVTLNKRLVEAGVTISPHSLLLEIDDRGIYLDCEDELVYIEADTVILAVGVEPNSKIVDVLERFNIPTYVIGDCLEPRDAKDAVV